MDKKLTTEHLKLVLQSLESFKTIRQELKKELGGNPEKIKELMADHFGWSLLYELNFIEQMAVSLLVMGLGENINTVKEMEDPYTYLLTQLEEDSPDKWEKPDIDGFKIEEHDFFAVVFSLSKTIDSINIYGKTLNTLVKEVSQGRDQSLFDAVKIDHSIVSSPTLASRISRAELEDDDVFFKRLKSAISSRPRKQTKAYDELRFLLVILEEQNMLDSLSIEEAYQMMCLDLKVYPEIGKDPAGSLYKQIERFKKSHWTSN